MRVKVIEAYKGNHFPLNGNISEELLLLENNFVVFLAPDIPDVIVGISKLPEDNINEAALLGASTKWEFSESLTKVWQDSEGYEIE